MGKSLPYEECVAALVDAGLEVLTTKEEYTGASSAVTVKCKQCNQSRTGTKTNLLKSPRCRNCMNTAKKGNSVNTLSYDEVCERLRVANIMIVTTREEYANSGNITVECVACDTHKIGRLQDFEKKPRCMDCCVTERASKRKRGDSSAYAGMVEFLDAKNFKLMVSHELYASLDISGQVAIQCPMAHVSILTVGSLNNKRSFPRFECAQCIQADLLVGRRENA